MISVFTSGEGRAGAFGGESVNIAGETHDKPLYDGACRAIEICLP